MPTNRAPEATHPSTVERIAAAVGCGIVMLSALLLTDCTQGLTPAFTQLIEARRLGAELLVRFTKCSDAANRAVMADTDEASEAYAREAQQEAQAVEQDVQQLETLVHGLGYADETGLLKEFREAFAAYRKLDGEILQLAVENTNLKAQRLSLGPGGAAADAMSDALTAIPSSAAMKDAWRVRALAASAVAAVREIQALQAPHIAASEADAMTELEKRMAASEASARGALQELATLQQPELRSSLDAAGAALDRFMGIHAQLISLSRRNSNVRSLALSLGQKPGLTASCERILRTLAAALGKHELTATR